MTEALRVLFVCSRNQWRSPTAERVWGRDPDVVVRSAGTSSSARRRVSEADLRWADVVFVMESRHRDRLVAAFQDLGRAADIVVLGIEDEYEFMDPELVELVEVLVRPHLDDRLS